MKGRRAALMVMALLPMLPSAAGALTGRDVIVKWKEVRDCAGKDATSTFRMQLASKRGEQVTRTIVSYHKRYGADQSKSLVFFREPEDIAGTGLLVWSDGGSDQQWLYLPDLGRVRQIAASARGESFMGTDFNYSDLADTDVDERTHELLGEEEFEGQPVYKLESVPKESDIYRKVVSWVNRETFLPVRIEYYDTAGALLKTGSFRDVRLVSGVPTPFAIAMENVQTGHSTKLSLLEIDCGRALKDELFTERYLKRGP